MSGKQFLYIVIATFITVLIWFGLDIVHSRSKVQVSPEVQQLIEPVNPNFDLKSLDDL